jgi:hypothetical protein
LQNKQEYKAHLDGQIGYKQEVDQTFKFMHPRQRVRFDVKHLPCNDKRVRPTHSAVGRPAAALGPEMYRAHDERERESVVRARQAYAAQVEFEARRNREVRSADRAAKGAGPGQLLTALLQMHERILQSRERDEAIVARNKEEYDADQRARAARVREVSARVAGFWRAFGGLGVRCPGLNCGGDGGCNPATGGAGARLEEHARAQA